MKASFAFAFANACFGKDNCAALDSRSCRQILPELFCEHLDIGRIQHAVMIPWHVMDI
jgi:hypothetical protein